MNWGAPTALEHRSVPCRRTPSRLETAAPGALGTAGASNGGAATAAGPAVGAVESAASEAMAAVGCPAVGAAESIGGRAAAAAEGRRTGRGQAAGAPVRDDDIEPGPPQKIDQSAVIRIASVAPAALRELLARLNREEGQ